MRGVSHRALLLASNHILYLCTTKCLRPQPYLRFYLSLRCYQALNPCSSWSLQEAEVTHFSSCSKTHIFMSSLWLYMFSHKSVSHHLSSPVCILWNSWCVYSQEKLGFTVVTNQPSPPRIPLPTPPALTKQRLICHLYVMFTFGWQGVFSAWSPREADKGSTIFYEKHLEMKPPSGPQERKGWDRSTAHRLLQPQPRNGTHSFSNFFARNAQKSLPECNDIEKFCLEAEREGKWCWWSPVE